MNRRIAVLGLGMAGVTLWNRLVGASFDARAAHVIATDLALIGALALGVTTREARSIGVVAPLQFACALACVLLPGAASHVFTLDGLATAALLAWKWER